MTNPEVDQIPADTGIRRFVMEHPVLGTTALVVIHAIDAKIASRHERLGL